MRKFYGDFYLISTHIYFLEREPGAVLVIIKTGNPLFEIGINGFHAKYDMILHRGESKIP